MEKYYYNIFTYKKIKPTFLQFSSLVALVFMCLFLLGGCEANNESVIWSARYSRIVSKGTIKIIPEILEPEEISKSHVEAGLANSTHLNKREGEVNRKIIYQLWGDFGGIPTALIMMNSDGSNREVLVSDFAGYYQVFEEALYFTIIPESFDEGLYKEHIENRTMTPISESDLFNYPQHGYRYIRFLNSRIGLYKMDLETRETIKILDNSDYKVSASILHATKEYVYLFNSDLGIVQRVNQTTNEIETVYTIDDQDSFMDANIEGNYLYIVYDDSISKIDLESKVTSTFELEEEVMEYGFNLIKFNEKYLYFYNAYGSVFKLDFANGELIKVLIDYPDVEGEPVSYTNITDEYFYFTKYANQNQEYEICAFRLNYDNLEVNQIYRGDELTNSEFIIEPTEEFLIKIRESSSAYWMTKIYLDDFEMVEISDDWIYGFTMY